VDRGAAATTGAAGVTLLQIFALVASGWAIGASMATTYLSDSRATAWSFAPIGLGGIVIVWITLEQIP